MTDSTIATPEEMLSALERWAHAKGLLFDTNADREGWQIDPRHASGPTIWAPFAYEGQEVGPEVAIAWALTVDAALPLVNVGPCPTCMERGAWGRPATFDWDVRLAVTELDAAAYVDASSEAAWHAEYLEADGFDVVVVSEAGTAEDVDDFLASIEDAEQNHPILLVASRPCRDCRGSGQDARDPARLVLDAAPRLLGHSAEPCDCLALNTNGRRPLDDCRKCKGSGCVLVEQGDPKAIEALTALADHLQPHAFDQRKPDRACEAAGRALAHLVALWLDGDLRETKASVDDVASAWGRLTIRCERCSGSGLELVRADELLPSVVAQCRTCNGHGRVKPSEKDEND